MERLPKWLDDIDDLALYFNDPDDDGSNDLALYGNHEEDAPAFAALEDAAGDDTDLALYFQDTEDVPEAGVVEVDSDGDVIM